MANGRRVRRISMNHLALPYTQSGVSTLPERLPMQILHPFVGTIQQYSVAIADPDRYRPDHCPQCAAKQPLAGHGFYQRTLADVAFDGVIRVRRYLCRLCKRTVDQPCSEDQAWTVRPQGAESGGGGEKGR